jgi:hypothetical protein
VTSESLAVIVVVFVVIAIVTIVVVVLVVFAGRDTPGLYMAIWHHRVG